jgi:hypothetical protein
LKRANLRRKWSTTISNHRRQSQESRLELGLCLSRWLSGTNDRIVWLDRRAPFDPDERPFLFWIACLLMFCLLGVTFFWVSGAPLNNLGDFIGVIMIGYILTWCLLLTLSLPYITWISLRWLRTWLAQNLPRGLVSRYRSWQLRRTGRRLRRDAAQELAENHIH